MFLPGKLFSIGLIALFAASACTKEDVTVKVAVSVKTNKGDPVSGATVVLGKPNTKDPHTGETLGQTNNLGLLNTQILLPAGSKKTINVLKSSDTYYFAPHTEGFTVGEVAEQKVNVDATLYFVPKPVPDKTTATASTEEPVTPAVNITPTTPDPVAVEETPEETPSVVEEKVTEPVEEDLSVTKPVEPMLSSVSADESKDLQMDYPKPEKKKPGSLIYTVHVESSDKAIAGAKVFMGMEEKGDLKLGCETNARGRCVVKFAVEPERPVTFVVRKKGYRTLTTQTAIRDKGNIRLELIPGRTIDVFAITKNYNFTKGLPGVTVSINGKQVGLTDRYGHLTYLYKGKENDLVTIAMKSNKYLPEHFETDFVASGQMSVTRYFTPGAPPPATLTLLNIRSSGEINSADGKMFDGELDRSIRRAALKFMFNNETFKEYSLISFNREAKRNKTTVTELMNNGWTSNDLKAVVDGLVLPTIINSGSDRMLELSVIGSDGKVMSAAKEKLESIDDNTAIDRAMAAITKKLLRRFPFEGAVTKTAGNGLEINIGYEAGRNVAIGDKVEIWGVQSDKLGRNQNHKRIGWARITAVEPTLSRAKVLSTEPRSVIQRGDQVVLRQQRANIAAKKQKVDFKLKIVDAGSKTGLSQANVYLNDTWIGSTDNEGRLYSDYSSSGMLKVVKHGYEDYQKQINLKKTTTIQLRRQTAFVRVASVPTGAPVFVDGKSIGKTPLSSPVPVPSGFVKLTVEGPPGFKAFNRVLELDQGTLDLTGANEIVLEKDVRTEALSLLDQGKIDSAVEKLKSVDETHSDYLVARHDLGEILLSRKQDPAGAAAAFNEVTSKPVVKSFNDKRFIGTHINEGIALYMTAEKLRLEQPETAKSHYLKAIEVLRNVKPQLRFVPGDQYAQAVHNVSFHIALSQHKLWESTNSIPVLNETVRAWQDYLEGSAVSTPIEKGNGFLENARVYYKQAMASLDAEKTAVQQ